MSSFEGKSEVILDWKIPFNILGDFVKLSAMSVLIGLVFGFSMSYITKRARFISHSAIGESFIMICFGLMSYELSEVLESSGIVSLLTTAIIMAHYTWHNLSPQGKHVTSVLF